MVRRIFVEKKRAYRVEAEGIFADIKQSLNIKSLKGIRILNRYDIEGVCRDVYQQAKDTVFSEPALDHIYEVDMPPTGEFKFFGIEYLPGQYDQRADSAAQCMAILKPGTDATVKYAKIIVAEGKLSEEELEILKDYMINPVDSREADLSKPSRLESKNTEPEDVKFIEGFCAMNETELEELRGKWELAMSREDLVHIHDYFCREEKRDPTVTEIRVIDTYWSDHCRHTTFNAELTDVYFEEEVYGNIVKEAFTKYMEIRREVYGETKKPISLMDMACIGVKYLRKQGLAGDIDISDEINACSIKVKVDIDGNKEDWLVMFKNETHNHPTEIEPFGGAATCLGGAIRDPLSGRVYVYQAMRVTGSGDPTAPLSRTLPGKLPQRKITREAAQGYSSYGNQIGLATGQVSEIYHPDYVAKRMEVGAVIGAAPACHVIRSTPSADDAIILLGGRTGRDGCGGATGSSKEHTENSIEDCGAEVQKGNPPVERNIQRLFRRKEVSTLIKRCNDFGAGGVSVAIGELADGLDIDLDLVPKKYEGLDGTELAISESQERMAVVVAPEEAQRFIAFAAEENLEATIVAKVTKEARIRMKWRGKEILSLDRTFLDTNGARQFATVKVKSRQGLEELRKADYSSPEEYLSDLNGCSQKGLIDRFDSTIGAATVLMPLGGKYQLSPAMGMAAKLPVIKGETKTATLMTYGFDPKMAGISPFHGAMYAVIDSITKLVAMGGDRKKIYLSFQEYFEKLSDAESWGKPMAALLGALTVQREMGTPAIGGKDSMSGTFMDIHVPPALISFAVASVDSDHVISTEFKKSGSHVVLLKNAWNDKQIIDFEGYKKNMDKVDKLTRQGKILAACALGRGGLFQGIIKMAVGNKIGCKLNARTSPFMGETAYGDIVLEISKKENIEELLTGVDYIVVGQTMEQASIKWCSGEETRKLSIKEVIKRMEAPLAEVFPIKADDDVGQKAEMTVDRAKARPPASGGLAIRVAKPRILIPTFPGTNCETDSKRAFDKAGGEVEIFIVRNMNSEILHEAIRELAEKINESQIVMIPGGFSGGDEPDGSAKFITAVFRNGYVTEAVTKLLEKRDGMMLGICNGFQALIKLGLVPFGKIVDTDENSPTLTYNKIGRHQSSLVRTGVSSAMSPWLRNTQVGDVYTIPISHGEGNFICNTELLKQLSEGGQIATQYVDREDKPSMDIKYNPNHSAMAVEGITDPTGRVFGKMGHAERIGDNVYKNVPGPKDMGLFRAGVDYFK